MNGIRPVPTMAAPRGENFGLRCNLDGARATVSDFR